MSIPAPIETKPAAPATEMIKVRVNGKEVEAPKTMPDPVSGKPLPTTMIQACAIAQVDVPHYCYHPKLPVAGNCRMCLVEFGTPAIVLDGERWILCTRCIRFTRDVVGDDALGIVNRGSYNTLTAYPGKVFDNNYTLNTVDICPVGALTSKDFRFKMRVWFLKETKSLCTSCATGCNIVIGSREGTIYRYEPRENDAVNACWMCDYGRLNYKWIGREDRLLKVLSPKSKVLSQPEGWAAVLGAISEKLKQAATGSVAVIGSARQTNEELYLLAKLAKKLGALTDSVPRVGEGDRLLLNVDQIG